MQCLSQLLTKEQTHSSKGKALGTRLSERLFFHFLRPDPPPANHYPSPATRYPSTHYPPPVTRHPSPAEKSCRPIKRGNQKKKKNNKHYKKRYFSNIILHDIACTSNIYPATRQVRQCLRQPRPQGFSF